MMPSWHFIWVPEMLNGAKFIMPKSMFTTLKIGKWQFVLLLLNNINAARFGKFFAVSTDRNAYDPAWQLNASLCTINSIAMHNTKFIALIFSGIFADTPSDRKRMALTMFFFLLLLSDVFSRTLNKQINITSIHSTSRTRLAINLDECQYGNKKGITTVDDIHVLYFYRHQNGNSCRRF